MSREELIESYLKILYDKKDRAVFCSFPGSNSKSVKAIEDGMKCTHAYLSINPIKINKSRSKLNVAVRRNMLFEIDAILGDDLKPILDANGKEIPMPHRDQVTFMKDRGLPWSTMLHTANKSIHYIVSLETPAETDEIYNAIWDTISNILGNRTDRKVKHCGAVGRSPGAIRTDKIATPTEQRVLRVNSRISMETLEAWFAENGETWQERIIPKNTTYNTGELNTTATDQERIDYMEEFNIVDKGDWRPGNGHDFMWKLCSSLKRIGVSESGAKSYMESFLVSHNDKKAHDNVRNGLKIWNKSIEELGGPISFHSKESRSRYGIEQRVREQHVDSSASVRVLSEDIPEPTYEEDLFFKSQARNYMHIGNGTFMKDPRIGWEKLHQMADKTIARNGIDDDGIHSFPNYTDYCNKPEHVNYRRVIGSYVNLYNDVQWENLNICEGPTKHWDEIIEHLFGKNEYEDDQTDYIYLWLYLLLAKPTQKLHQLVLYGEPGSSKSFFAQCIHWMIKDNYVKRNLQDLSGTFTSSWATKLLIHINEPSGDVKLKEKVYNAMKDIVDSPTIKYEEKGGQPTEVDCVIKFLVTTNDPDAVLMKSEDRKIWARWSSALKEHQKKDNFNNLVQAELPHIIWKILNRKRSQKRSECNNFYINRRITDTYGFKSMVQGNLSDIGLKMQAYLDNMFANDKGLKVAHLHLGELSEAISTRTERISAKAIGKELKNLYKLKGNTQASEGTSSITGKVSAYRWWTLPREVGYSEASEATAIFDKVGVFEI